MRLERTCLNRSERRSAARGLQLPVARKNFPAAVRFGETRRSRTRSMLFMSVDPRQPRPPATAKQRRRQADDDPSSSPTPPSSSQSPSSTTCVCCRRFSEKNTQRKTRKQRDGEREVVRDVEQRDRLSRRFVNVSRQIPCFPAPSSSSSSSFSFNEIDAAFDEDEIRRHHDE